MIYAIDITTPKNTSSLNLKRTVLKLEMGEVKQLDIDIPAGHAGLTGIKINRGLNQVWPTNSGSFFIGDDVRISHTEAYRLKKPPYQLEFYTYNLDDTYDHTFYIRIGIKPITEKQAGK